MLSFFPSEDEVFQQHNTPYHSAQIALEWFQKHNNEFQLISWIPNATDLNPIEHIWHVMQQQLGVKK